MNNSKHIKLVTCIAEKPSVAKDIAKVLGCDTMNDGYFEGHSTFFPGAVTRVTWTYGHLCELKNPHDYFPAWKKWNYAQLPLIPPHFQIALKSGDSTRRQFDVIKRLFCESDVIVNCGDAGQEGELIQRWVLQKTGTPCKDIKRLWINSMTEEAIRDGFKHLREQADYQPLYEAGLARSISDWLVGMNATRYYSIMNKSHSLRSVGRVQTPTLGLIVHRQEEIDSFIPETTYGLNTVYRETTFTSDEGPFKDKKDAEDVVTAIQDKPFEITKISTKKANEAPPKLYDLTSLQVDMNKKYGYSADQTLTTLQSLYEMKLVTYPRVDTTFLPDDVYGECPAILNNLYNIYPDFISKLDMSKLRKDKRYFDSSKVTDHHAIIPTKVSPYSTYGGTKTLTAEQSNLYNNILRHFIAIFYPDCVTSVTSVEGKAAKVKFKTTGHQLLDGGWYEVFDKTLSDKVMPNFVKGESGAHKPGVTEKTTTAPAPYTEATLLRAMETAGKNIDDDEIRDAMKENGIGRPSTRAAIIELLFKRGYIEHQGKKNLIPTSTGVALINALDDPLLASAELTGQWEKKLREVENGRYPVADFLGEVKDMCWKLVHKKPQQT